MFLASVKKNELFADNMGGRGEETWFSQIKQVAYVKLWFEENDPNSCGCLSSFCYSALREDSLLGVKLSDFVNFV